MASNGSLPYFVGSYVAGGLTNSLFPAVNNYSDGRIVTLLVTGCLCFVGLIVYCAGVAPDWASRFDLYTGEYMLRTFASGHGSTTYKTAAKVSRFGGMLSLIVCILAAGLCTDALIQYGEEFYFERSYTLPQMDGTTTAPTNGAVTIVVDAVRLPGQSGDCLIYPSANRWLYNSFRLTHTRSVLSVPSDPMSTLTCSFTLSQPTFAILQSPYAFSGTAGGVATMPVDSLPLLSAAMGTGLQVTGVSVTVSDAKEGSYTVGSLSKPLASNATAGRTLTGRMLVTPSLYVDRSYFDTPASSSGVTHSGYRAAFTDFASVPGTPPPSGDTTGAADTLQLVFLPSGVVLTTERTPKMGILQLLGVLWGLVVGILIMGKLAYELADSLFGCVLLDRPMALFCLTCGRRGSALPGMGGRRLGDRYHGSKRGDGVGEQAIAVSLEGAGYTRAERNALAGGAGHAAGATPPASLFRVANPIGGGGGADGRELAIADGGEGSSESRGSGRPARQSAWNRISSIVTGPKSRGNNPFTGGGGGGSASGANQTLAASAVEGGSSSSTTSSGGGARSPAGAALSPSASAAASAGSPSPALLTGAGRSMRNLSAAMAAAVSSGGSGGGSDAASVAGSEAGRQRSLAARGGSGANPLAAPPPPKRTAVPPLPLSAPGVVLSGAGGITLIGGDGKPLRGRTPFSPNPAGSGSSSNLASQPPPPSAAGGMAGGGADAGGSGGLLDVINPASRLPAAKLPPLSPGAASARGSSGGASRPPAFKAPSNGGPQGAAGLPRGTTVGSSRSLVASPTSGAAAGDGISSLRQRFEK
jgi:hypothetical protein